MWHILIPLISFSVSTTGEQSSARVEKIPIAVMDIKGASGIDRSLAAALTTTITQELDSLGVFESVSLEEVRQMVALENTRDALGCETSTCLAEIAGAVGAQYSINGNALKVGDAFILQLQLVDTLRARPVARTEREYRGGPAGLFGEARTAIQILVRDLLAKKSGTLALTSSELGATVKLDGSIVGITPLGPFQAAGGLHTLSVEKQGFVLFARAVQIAPHQISKIYAPLVPSEEYKREYLEQANEVRWFAWAGTLTGGALLIGSGVLAKRNIDESNALNDDIAAQNADPTSRTRQAEADVNNRQGDLQTLNRVAWVLGGLGVAALGAGVTLFIVGDDPHHFDARTTAEPVKSKQVTSSQVGFSLEAALMPGGIALRGRF
jgi:TolB-like protein